MGTCVYSPYLYAWYKWLDNKYVGTSMKIVAKKVFLDQFLMTPPLYIMFFTGEALNLWLSKDIIISITDNSILSQGCP